MDEMNKDELISHIKIITKERDDLTIKLHSCRSQKKTFSNKHKSSKAYLEATREAMKLTLEHSILKKVEKLTSGIYLGTFEKKHCPECNENGVFNYSDERCEMCRGKSYIYVDKYKKEK